MIVCILSSTRPIISYSKHFDALSEVLRVIQIDKRYEMITVVEKERHFCFFNER